MTTTSMREANGVGVRDGARPSLLGGPLPATGSAIVSLRMPSSPSYFTKASGKGSAFRGSSFVFSCCCLQSTSLIFTTAAAASW